MRKKYQCFFLISIFSFSLPTFSKPNSKIMNGYSAAQFGDFSKHWRLVTVRFRKDTGEMRWTYANKKAWKVLRENGTNYPDGAVFAKIGVMTKEDPAFPSSSVPSGARRLQFMVKDRAKHASTEGWGYAIFDADGKVFPGNETQAIAACAACHRLVPQRGYVFSQPVGLFLGEDQGWRKHLGFLSKKVASLPENVRKHLPKGTESVWAISGEVSEHVFPGTLDEVVPVLTKEALSRNLPVILINKPGDLFSLVIPMGDRGSCASGERRMKSIHSVASLTALPYEREFCQREK
jgi:hypothetical protein